MKAANSSKVQENPLNNILFNVIIPVTALGMLSKGDDSPLQQAAGEKLWHIGPLWAMIIAIALPLGYGIRHFIQTKKPNFFSILGVISILLTGGITLYSWNNDGSIKENAAQLFALKEASIPLIFGSAVLFSFWTKTPLVKAFLFNPDLFNIPLIEKKVALANGETSYKKLLFQVTLLLAGSFFISMIANYFLAMHFLGAIDIHADDARVAYNAAVGKLTGWGFAIIGIPMIVFLMVALFHLMKGLKKITGLDRDDLMIPR